MRRQVRSLPRFDSLLRTGSLPFGVLSAALLAAIVEPVRWWKYAMLIDPVSSRLEAPFFQRRNEASVGKGLFDVFDPATLTP
jgi:hypothetical protein